MLSQIHSPRAPSEVRERYRAGQIRDQQPEKRMHLRRFPPHHDAQRASSKSPRCTKSVVEIADVMLLDEVGVVSENGDRRGRRLDLRCIVELHLSTRGLRRLL